MITLKGPLQLYTTNPILTYSDQLGSKILGNYDLMSINITPQDLLHITMQEPEVYVEQEAGGTVLVENHISNYHQSNLEFMNQFINRIMLIDTPQFTYQDEVFVSTVLQKLGITDISEFISQVKIVKEHTELMQNLVNQYFAVAPEIKEVAEKVLEKDYIRSEKETILEKADETISDAFYMNVIKRLQVAKTNNILYEFRKPTAAEIMFNHDTMTLMPFIQQSDMIELQQLRDHIYGQRIENVLPQMNVYEQKYFKEGEVTEQYVTGTLSSAILLNLIKDVAYEVRQHFYADTYIWQDYKKVMYGNAMDTFKRFEHYQQQEITQLVDNGQYESKMLQLYEDEYSLVSMLYRINDYKDEEEADPFNAVTEHTYLSLMDNQNLQQILTLQQKITEKIEKNIVNAKYYKEDVAFLEPLKEKEESLLLLKEIVLEDIGQLRTAQGILQAIKSSKTLEKNLQQYYTEKEQLTELPVIENVYETYEKILTNLRQDIYQGKHVDDIDYEVSLLERLENIQITELNEDAFTIGGEEVTRNEFAEYITQAMTKLEEQQKSVYVQQITDNRQYIDDPQLLHVIKQQYEQLQKEETITQNEQINTQTIDLTHQTQNLNRMTNEEITEESQKTYLSENDTNLHVTEQIRQEYFTENQTALTQLEVSNVENLEQLMHIAMDTTQIQNQSMTEEEYRIYLQQINEKNLRIQQLLQEAVLPKQKNNRVVVDRKQALKQSIRALEHPQEVLKEIQETAKPIEREAPARIRQYLELTDEKTRVMLEEVMGIRHHVEQIEHTEAIRPTVSSVEQILKREQQLMEEREEPKSIPWQMSETTREILLHYMEQIDHYEKQNQETRHDIENTLNTIDHKTVDNVINIENHVLELIKAPIADMETMNREDVVVFEQKTQSEITRMIHKEKQQLREEIKEEVLNSLDRIQINHTQEIDYEQVENMTQKQIEETKREIIKKQQETVQEIVNRNLLTQIGTISDKVYKDIERKLQSERRRRGY